MRVETIGDCTLCLGDCRTVFDELDKAIYAEASVLTDPPYGISYQSGHATDALWSGREITNDGDASVRDGVIGLFGDNPMLVFGSRKVAPPPATRMTLTWDKGPALGMGALDLPWKPSTEEIYVLGHGFVGSRDEGSCLYHPPVQSMAKNGRLHPNEKPVGLLAKLLRKMPVGLVIDPFMGSGSTAEACWKMGRPFLGCEIDSVYFERAVERLRRLERQPDLFAAVG